MSKAIVFDLDGTLVDSAPDLMDAHNYVMQKFGYHQKPTYRHKTFGWQRCC